MRRHLTAGLLAGLTMTGYALAQDAPPAPDAATVLATVNGVDITLGHAIVMRERLPEQYQSLPDETLMSGILDQLIDQTLLAAVESDTEGSDPLEVKLHLENERRGTLAAMVVQERIGAPVDEAAVQATYDAQAAAFTPTKEFNASHILVASEDEAKDLITQIEAGEDFGELAKIHSTDPGSGPNGGSLGWFGAGQMVPEFETAVQSLTAGAISAPVQTQFGWHVIQLVEVRDTAPPPLEQVRAEIENQIRQEMLTAELDALRAAAKIERPDTGLAPEAIRQTDLFEN